MKEVQACDPEYLPFLVNVESVTIASVAVPSPFWTVAVNCWTRPFFGDTGPGETDTTAAGGQSGASALPQPAGRREWRAAGCLRDRLRVVASLRARR